MKVGYYIFLGYGDYHPNLSNSKIWVNTWDLNRWKQFIDELLALDITTLMIYLNGHKLPYKSKLYPELIDINHPNCIDEYLEELLSYIKGKGIEVICVITTSGHSGKFSELNPELSIEVVNPDDSIEATLVSFPKHMQKDKLKKKEGAAQLGYGVLCHNKISAQKYTENIISEILALYGKYFDGVALHPPESAYPCVCQQCQKRCLKEKGVLLKEMDLKQQRTFFIATYLKYQSEVLFPLIDKAKPNCMKLTFTIPWLFESSFKEIKLLISQNTIIIDWDYNLDPKRIEGLGNRLKEYSSFCNNIWFMPSAGFSFDSNISIDEQLHSVYEQMTIAEDVGVKGIIHFLGPKTSEFIIETSRKSLLERQQNSIYCSY